MPKTAEELRALVTTNKLSKLVTRTCTQCGYPLGFIFDDGLVGYDNGCDCVSYGPVINERSWTDFADFYNRQTDANYIATLDAALGAKP